MALEPAQRVRQAHLMRFRGVAHPTGEANDYDGLFLTKEQIEERSRDVVGTPIWHEHGEQGVTKIGWVTAGSVGDKNQLVVDAVIDRNSFEGARVARMMKAGKLKGLSLGMDHMVSEDQVTGRRRVIAKTIGEVSVTDDPDRPDTFISDIAPDSEMWDITRQRVVSGLEKRRTKNALNKKRTEILQLFRQAASDLEAERLLSQHNSAHTKEADLTVVDSSAPTSFTPENDAPMSSAEQQVGGEAQTDLSEMEMMRQKLAQIEADKQKLQSKLLEQDGMVQAWRDNPDKLKEIVARHNAKLQTMQEKMAEDEQELIDKVAADMIAAGVDPEKNQEIFETIKAGKNDPEAYKPLYTILKTTAGAASEKRATDMEVQYQAKNAETERLLQDKQELQQRLDAADAARIQMETQFKQQQDVEQRAQTYKGFVSGFSSDTQPSRKRSRHDEDAAAQSSAGATAATATTQPDSGAFFDYSAAPANLGVHAPRVFNPLAGAEDETSSRLLSLFSQGRGRSGMGRLDVPNLVGKDYGKLTDGANADGTIDARAPELRSQRPPIAFAAGALHQA